MRHRYHYILYLLLGICLMSCGNDAPIDSPNADSDMLLMLSRAGTTPDATYGVMVYDGINTYRYGNYTVDPDDPQRKRLIPFYTIVDDKVEVDYGKGVYVPSGTYNMVLVSPAPAIPVRDNLSEKWTFEYVRNPGESYTPLYVSKAFSVDIYNRGEILDIYNDDILNRTYYTSIDLTDNHDIHLQEHRSLVNLIIECGEKITDTSIKDVKIDNLIKRAEYNPETDCFNDDASASVEVEEIIELFSDDDGLVLSHDVNGTKSITLPKENSGEQTFNGKDYIYILSQDYSETSSYGVFLHVTPRIIIKFTDDAESIIPLNVNFEPHKRYTYRVSIQSYYIGVKVTVEPWDSGTSAGGVSTSVSDDNTSIFIGNFDITPWDSNGSQSTTIGGNTN